MGLLFLIAHPRGRAFVYPEEFEGFVIPSVSYNDKSLSLPLSKKEGMRR